MNKIPPAPLGWNKTISDLLAEAKRGERASVGSPEVDWARDYEQSNFPSGVRFPRRGDVYEATKDIAVQYLTAWKTAYTGGGDAVLVAGDQVVVDQQPLFSKPIGVYVKPIDYARAEERIVPVEVRTNPSYSGFYLFLKTVELNSLFKLIHEAG